MNLYYNLEHSIQQKVHFFPVSNILFLIFFTENLGKCVLGYFTSQNFACTNLIFFQFFNFSLLGNFP